MSASDWSALADRFAALAAEQEFQFNTYPFSSPATFHDDEGRFRLAYPFGGTPSAPESHVSVIGTGERQRGEFTRINRFRWLSWAAGMLLRPDPLTPPELHWWRFVRDRNTEHLQPHTVPGSTKLAELIRASAEAARHLATHGTPQFPTQAVGKQTNNWPSIQDSFRVLRERFNSPRWHTARPSVSVAAFPDYHSYDGWSRRQMQRSEPQPSDYRPWACRGMVSGDPKEVDAFSGLATDAGTALPLQLTFAPPLFPWINCFSNMSPDPGHMWLEFLFLTCPTTFTLSEDTPAAGCRVATLNNSPFTVSVMAIDRLLAQGAEGFLRQFHANVDLVNPWFAEDDRRAVTAAIEATNEGGVVTVNTDRKSEVHWTDFPNRVERFGDLLSILETLHRDRNQIHFESFANETEESAYTVEPDGGVYHVEPRPERMPGVERLLARLEQEGRSELSPRWLRDIRRRVSASLGIDSAAVDDLTLERAAEALDAADQPPPAAPPTAAPSAPSHPDRAALDAACQLTLAAIRDARTLPLHRELGTGPNIVPSLGERCETVQEEVNAARAAVEPLVMTFRAVTTYAGDQPFCGKFWASAHEAAVAAANDLLWRFHPACGDPGHGPEDRVYAELERDVEREHAAAVARCCPSPPAPTGITTFGDLLLNVQSVEQAAAATRAEADAMNGAPGAGALRIQAALFEAEAEYKKYASFPALEAYVNAHYGPVTSENLVRLRGAICQARGWAPSDVERLALGVVARMLADIAATPSPGSPNPADAAVAAPSGPFTLCDIRDLIRYHRAHAAYLARLRSINPNEVLNATFGRALGINPVQNLNVLLALQEPQPPRMTEDDAATQPTYHWLVTDARTTYHTDLDEETLRLLVGRVAIPTRKTVPELMALPLDEFERVRRSILVDCGPKPSPPSLMADAPTTRAAESSSPAGGDVRPEQPSPRSRIVINLEEGDYGPPAPPGRIARLTRAGSVPRSPSDRIMELVNRDLPPTREPSPPEPPAHEVEGAAIKLCEHLAGEEYGRAEGDGERRMLLSVAQAGPGLEPSPYNRGLAASYHHAVVWLLRAELATIVIGPQSENSTSTLPREPTRVVWLKSTPELWRRLRAGKIFDAQARDPKPTPGDLGERRDGRPKLGEGPKTTPEQKALRNVYELVRAAMQARWGPKTLMKHFRENKDFKDLLKLAKQKWGEQLFRKALAWIKDNPGQKTRSENVS